MMTLNHAPHGCSSPSHLQWTGVLIWSNQDPNTLKTIFFNMGNWGVQYGPHVPN
jgi:hypothetical protein